MLHRTRVTKGQTLALLYIGKDARASPLVELIGHTSMERKASLLVDQFNRFRSIIVGRYGLQFRS